MSEPLTAKDAPAELPELTPLERAILITACHLEALKAVRAGDYGAAVDFWNAALDTLTEDAAFARDNSEQYSVALNASAALKNVAQSPAADALFDRAVGLWLQHCQGAR